MKYPFVPYTVDELTLMCLQMYGEKVEEAEELRLDLLDVKERTLFLVSFGPVWPFTRCSARL
jgi:hypothetical protein